MRIAREFVQNFKRFKTAGILNVVGLSVAFAAFAVIVIQLSFQEGYDRFHKNADRIFRMELLFPMNLQYAAFGPTPIGGLLKDQSPLVDDYFIIANSHQSVFLKKKTDGTTDKFKAPINSATASFADMLGINVLEGDARQALTEPDMLMLPQSFARTWFEDGSAVGKQISSGGKVYTVAAVYEDMPLNSIFKNTCYTRFVEQEEWGNWDGQIFVLAANSDRDALQQQVNNLKIETLDQIFEGLHKKEQMEQEGKSYLRVSPLTDIFYDNTVIYDTSDKGNRRNAAVMLAVGILIILIAGINFVNFSMSLAPTRMKSINTQKVLGATVMTLRLRLLGEAVVYTCVAFLLSLGILQLFSMSGLSGLFSMSLVPANHGLLLGGVAGLAVLLGIIAGIYPAFYVTSFEPAVVLKGSFVMTPKGIRLRNGLMAFQFVISIVLITCTLIMGNQYRFMQHYSLGYQTENIAWMILDDKIEKNQEALISEVTAIPGVLDYTFSDYVPGNDFVSSSGTELDGEAIQLDRIGVYKNFLDFFGMTLVKGDNFSASNLSGYQLIMNETAIQKQPVLDRYFGRNIPQDIVGNGQFIGVVNDIHYMSLRKPVAPLVLLCSAGQEYSYMFFKIAGGDVSKTIQQIRHVYEHLAPEGIFELHFLDDSLQQKYESEKRLMQVVSLMGGIAIVLALVGVYGLIIFNAQYRRKEIGIRKVNGATESQIMFLLNKSFFRLLFFSFIVACPVAWYAMSRWLEGFSYKTPIYWWIFLAAGVITLIIALFTISWQSWKAATENPVKALKTE